MWEAETEDGFPGRDTKTPEKNSWKIMKPLIISGSKTAEENIINQTVSKWCAKWKLLPQRKGETSRRFRVDLSNMPNFLLSCSFLFSSRATKTKQNSENSWKTKPLVSLEGNSSIGKPANRIIVSSKWGRNKMAALWSLCLSLYLLAI